MTENESMKNKEIVQWLEKEIKNKETQISGYRIYKSNNQSDIAKMLIVDLQKDIKILETIKQTYENNELKQEAVLTDEEKEWLKNFLKPFRDELKWISKYKCMNPKEEYIAIELETDSIRLPYFTADTMYKNMELGKGYILEDLGIYYKEDLEVKLDGINSLTIDCSSTERI